MARVEQRHVLTVTIAIVSTDCAACGVVFGLTEEFLYAHRRNGARFYCPNGHPLTYGTDELDRLKAQLQEEHRRGAKLLAENDGLLAEKQAQAKQITALEHEAKRVGDRIHAGVCPHFGRTFQNLARHMTTKHPKEAQRGR